MKLFSTNNSIQLCLGISPPSVVLGNRSVKFEQRFGLFALYLSRLSICVILLLPCVVNYVYVFCLYMC